MNMSKSNSNKSANAKRGLCSMKQIDCHSVFGISLAAAAESTVCLSLAHQIDRSPRLHHQGTSKKENNTHLNLTWRLQLLENNRHSTTICYLPPPKEGMVHRRHIYNLNKGLRFHHFLLAMPL